MSTNKTQNYQLHAWGLADEPTLGEVNENFTKLDGEAVRVVFGSYQGDRSEYVDIPRYFDLGGKPRAVIVTAYEGFGYGSSRYFSAMAAQDCPARTALLLDDGGFTIRNEKNGFILLNHDGMTYYYLALM